MPVLSAARVLFEFGIDSRPDIQFGVEEIKGTERLTSVFVFTLLLTCTRDDLNPEDLLSRDATLTFPGRTDREGDKTFVRGMVGTWVRLRRIDGLSYYRVNLCPAMSSLGKTTDSEIFLNKSVPEIITQVLKQAGITPDNFEFRLPLSAYPKKAFVTRFEESGLGFLHRLLESEGLHYFFEHGEKITKIIFGDNHALHKFYSPGNPKVVYAPESGLDWEKGREVVRSFKHRHNSVPAKVILRNYDYEKPSLTLQADAEVSEKGIGETFIFGENFKTLEEGKRIAKIRAQELKTMEDVYSGEGTVTGFRPGHVFELEKHSLQAYNAQYLIVAVSHTGRQTSELSARVKALPADALPKSSYVNTFTAIKADIGFRPERKTPRPRYYGVLNAFIESASDGKYADVDEQGRYFIRFAFDRSGALPGKASMPVRLAQPYAGEGCGMHFPLLKGTEVLVSFMDGDPDRPVISATAPNPATPSQVAEKNHTQAVLRTPSGNHMVFEDIDHGQYIDIHTPNADTTVRLGENSKVVNGIAVTTKKGILLKVGEYLLMQSGKASSLPEAIPHSGDAVMSAEKRLVLRKLDSQKKIAGDYTSLAKKILEITHDESNLTVEGNYRLRCSGAQSEVVKGSYGGEQKPADKKTDKPAEKKDDKPAAKKEDKPVEKGCYVAKIDKDLVEYVGGKKVEDVKGKKTVDIRGQKYEVVGGPFKISIGGKASVKAEATSDTFVGGSAKVTLGAKFGLGVGLSCDFSISGSADITLGIKKELSLTAEYQQTRSYGFELSAMVELSKSLFESKDSDAKVKKESVTVDTGNVDSTVSAFQSIGKV